MSLNAYYEDLKALAREKRVLHRVNTKSFGLADVRKIYRAEGLRIDYWPLPYKIKALYMCADGDCSVALAMPRSAQKKNRHSRRGSAAWRSNAGPCSREKIGGGSAGNRAHSPKQD